ncbi:DinB family protein [Marinobacterium lacunae]|uniref:DinB family protein n=2 Tax=Marinobacterium lacunae TaxID=1232683 RepID=A0A081G4C9_9GAMM|nr:DinB family protein [Marinobacterium lacunae]KEA65634.1 DinB family protein [Marinobacterium lacunae]
MGMKAHFELLAAYNQWLNSKVYEAASRLGQDALVKDRGAFFSSILGTLNHIQVGDILWLKRFATHPSCIASLHEVANLPDSTGLDQILFEDFAALSAQRAWLDRQIVNWVSELTERDLEQALSYRNTKGIASTKRFSSLILHFFNHQTHHRGQVTALLSQAGEDVGVTDLLVLIADEAEA